MKAAEKLKEMGPLSANEGKMCGTLGITVVMWIFGAQLGVSAALAAGAYTPPLLSST